MSDSLWASILAYVLFWSFTTYLPKNVGSRTRYLLESVGKNVDSHHQALSLLISTCNIVEDNWMTHVLSGKPGFFLKRTAIYLRVAPYTIGLFSTYIYFLFCCFSKTRALSPINNAISFLQSIR